jgi:hypothetical protein
MSAIVSRARNEFIRKVKKLGRKNGVTAKMVSPCSLLRSAEKAATERYFTGRGLQSFVTPRMN